MRYFKSKHYKSHTDFLSQKKGDPSQRGTVVVLLQDMLEVVTDMMVNEIRFNLKAVIFLEYINIYTH